MLRQDPRAAGVFAHVGRLEEGNVYDHRLPPLWDRYGRHRDASAEADG